MDMRSPRKPKEVQNIMDRLISLSHFISKGIDKYLPRAEEVFGTGPFLLKSKEGKLFFCIWLFIQRLYAPYF